MIFLLSTVRAVSGSGHVREHVGLVIRSPVVVEMVGVCLTLPVIKYPQTTVFALWCYLHITIPSGCTTTDSGQY